MPADSSTWVGNWNGAYPPIFYRTLSYAVSGDDLDPNVARIRSVNAVVAVVLVGGLVLLLPVRLRPAALLGVLGSSVPLGLFLLGSTNPSSWAYVGCVTLWLAVLGAYEQVGWRRQGLRAWILLTTLVAAGARGDAALFAVLVIAMGLVLALPHLRRDLVTGAVCLVSVGAAVVLFRRAGQSEVVREGVLGWDPSPLTGHELLLANLADLPRLWGGITGLGGLGRLGWYDTPMPWVVSLGSSLVLLALLGWGWSSANRRKVAAAVVAVGAAAAYPLLLLQLSHVQVGQIVQPRYVLPLLGLALGVSLVPRDQLVRMPRTLTYLLALVLSTAQAVALYVNLLRYTHGLPARVEKPLSGLADPEWWWSFAPFGPGVVFVLGSLAFTLLCCLVLVPLRGTLGRGRVASTIDG
jgi:hypothetical protein